MKTKNLMIGLAATAALAQVGISAAHADVNFSYTTSNTLATSGAKISGTGSPSNYFTDVDTSSSGDDTISSSFPVDDFLLFEMTPTAGSSTATTFSTLSDSFNAAIEITDDNGAMPVSGTFDFTGLSFAGSLSKKGDSVGFNVPVNDFLSQSQDIGGDIYTVTLTGVTNPSKVNPGEIGGDITVTASPAPEPSEIATLGLVGFGLLGLMVRARKANRVSGLAA